MTNHIKLISFVMLLLMISITFAQDYYIYPSDFIPEESDATSMEDNIEEMNDWADLDTTWMFGGTCSVDTGGLPTKDSPNPTVTWILPAFILLLISTIIIGGFYALSKALEDPKMTSWANNELYQILATAVMMVMLIM